jgi:hypothetical protein
LTDKTNIIYKNKWILFVEINANTWIIIDIHILLW